MATFSRDRLARPGSGALSSTVSCMESPALEVELHGICWARWAYSEFYSSVISPSVIHGAAAWLAQQEQSGCAGAAPASGRDASRETFPGLLVPWTSQHNEHHRWGSLKPQNGFSPQSRSFEILGSLLPASGGGWRPWLSCARPRRTAFSLGLHVLFPLSVPVSRFPF